MESLSTTFLEDNDNYDYNTKQIQAIINKIDSLCKEESTIEYAIQAYYFIRDSWSYNPYLFSLIENDWKASTISCHSSGHCIDKAIILIAVLRAKKIPARLGLAKVKNHIAVEIIMEKFGNDVLVPHGYVELYINNKWIKVTPAFDIKLCKRLNVAPLDFNGIEDSLFQAYDISGKREFMEYLEDYGTFDFVPLSYMYNLLKETYPAIKIMNVQLGTVLNLGEL